MNTPPEVTVAICCYNAEKYLPKLLELLIQQSCPLPWEVLIVDNNSNDNSSCIIKDFSKKSNTPVRYVLELEQGIPYARNRAIMESKGSTFLAFIDADELPDKNWLTTAIGSLQANSADCVGGEIGLDLPQRPAWLCDNLLPFLGQVNHGNTSFQIQDGSTPVWSGNIAYRMSLFSDDLCFDVRYNRKGQGIGGGSDAVLFLKLLEAKCLIYYEPEMRIIHLIPHEKLTRTYFLKLHYISGKKNGLYEINIGGVRKIFGVPRYMLLLVGMKLLTTLKLFITNRPYMREAMNLSHLIGQIVGLSQNDNSKGL